MNDAPPTGRALWIAGARPRTLPAAVVPVAVGAACAVGEGGDARVHELAKVCEETASAALALSQARSVESARASADSEPHVS